MGDRGTVDTIVPLGGAPKMRPPGGERRAESLQELVEELEGDGLKLLSTIEGRVDAPSRIQPHVWKWKTIRGHLDRAGELMRLQGTHVHRALILWNPGAKDHWDVTNTLTASVQMMRPGERVASHRHTHATIMFIRQGRGYTLVNGERVSFAAGDLVFAPSWAWHEHGDDGDEEIIWMTGLDRSLVKLLDAIYFEGYPDRHQAVTRINDGITPLAPRTDIDPRSSPQMVWRWKDTLAALEHRAKLGDASPCDDIIEVFRNPATGGHLSPTIGCTLQMLRPGVRTKAHRQTSSAVFHVVKGRGYSVIDGRRYEWSEGDYFSLPHRAWHEHANASPSEPAILFALTDEPAFDALGLLREERWEADSGHQPEA